MKQKRLLANVLGRKLVRENKAGEVYEYYPLGRFVVVAMAAACALAVPVSGFSSPRRAAWDQPQIQLVTAHGLLGGDATDFRPDDPLTAGDLSDLVAGLTGKPAVTPLDPSASVTIAQLDAALVRGEGLYAAAARFRAALVAAGLKPPARNIGAITWFRQAIRRMRNGSCSAFFCPRHRGSGVRAKLTCAW